MLKFYDTPSQKLREFIPANSKHVSIYSCGPTVYDYQHIGNYFGYICWDILVRLLSFKGYRVKRIINITDVGHLVSDADEGEDKLASRARKEGRSAWQIAEHYTKDFLGQMELLNNLKPYKYVKATDSIEEQIDFIKELEAKGFTYVINDGVYFDISKFPAYADFAKLRLDEDARERIKANNQKRQPQDFALWKFSPKGEQRDMEWDSPWGKGFPGWHIECSAMIKKYLGLQIDIHTGGIDHIPVHHTNEVAQSISANGVPLANYWLHNNFLKVNNQKISKSLGNGIKPTDLVAKGFSYNDFRLLVLQSHYRSEANFTWEALDAARQRRLRLQAFADLRFQLDDEDSGALTNPSLDIKPIVESLEADLNSPLALAKMDQLIDNSLGDSLKLHQKQKPILESFLTDVDKLLGLNLLSSSDIDQNQKTLLGKRLAARNNKDWATSDKIRDQLLSYGIALNDTPLGTIWSRQN